MIVVMSVPVLVSVAMIVRVSFAMVVPMSVIMRMPVIVRMVVRVIMIMRMAVVMPVVAGLTGCMVMPTAVRRAGLGLFLQQVTHAFFEVCIRLGREVVNDRQWLKPRYLKSLGYSIRCFFASRKLNEGGARLNLDPLSI
jgi:hypothetical protein